MALGSWLAPTGARAALLVLVTWAAAAGGPHARCSTLRRASAREAVTCVITKDLHSREFGALSLAQRPTHRREPSQAPHSHTLAALATGRARHRTRMRSAWRRRASQAQAGPRRPALPAHTARRHTRAARQTREAAGTCARRGPRTRGQQRKKRRGCALAHAGAACYGLGGARRDPRARRGARAQAPVGRARPIKHARRRQGATQRQVQQASTLPPAAGSRNSGGISIPKMSSASGRKHSSPQATRARPAGAAPRAARIGGWGGRCARASARGSRRDAGPAARRSGARAAPAPGRGHGICSV